MRSILIFAFTATTLFCLSAKSRKVHMVCEVAAQLSLIHLGIDLIFLARRRVLLDACTDASYRPASPSTRNLPQTILRYFQECCITDEDCTTDTNRSYETLSFLDRSSMPYRNSFRLRTELSFKPRIRVLLRPRACGTAKSRWRVTKKLNPRTT